MHSSQFPIILASLQLQTPALNVSFVTLYKYDLFVDKVHHPLPLQLFVHDVSTQGNLLFVFSHLYTHVTAFL